MSTDASVEALLSGLTPPLLILPTLQALQEHFGYVPDSALAAVAQACGVSRADVYGVLTYYSDLRRTPPSPVEVRICMGEACQAVGARELRHEAEGLVGPEVDVTHVYCMGNCALGPTAVVNGELLGRATSQALAERIQR
jgi:formate dehydrogenase subunit gamma